MRDCRPIVFFLPSRRATSCGCERVEHSCPHLAHGVDDGDTNHAPRCRPRAQASRLSPWLSSCKTRTRPFLAAAVELQASGDVNLQVVSVVVRVGRFRRPLRAWPGCPAPWPMSRQRAARAYERSSSQPSRSSLQGTSNSRLWAPLCTSSCMLGASGAVVGIAVRGEADPLHVAVTSACRPHTRVFLAATV